LSRIYIIGTADTKGEELAFLRSEITSLGHTPVVVDVGTRAPSIVVDVSAREVAEHASGGADAVLGTEIRGTAVAAMGEALSRYIVGCEDIAAVIGIGGGAGTSIATAAMRELPLGLPKLMVSTLASGDVAPYIDVSDITMMPSVTDLAGLNRLSRMILHNAAAAVAGMCAHSAAPATETPCLGLTMFGVTTPAVTAIVARLKCDYDCLVFHATGTGGRAMEKLVDSDMLVGILDITTTEVCDHLLGGVLSAGEARLDAIARRRLPYVGSVGALDMVNFWAMDTIPDAFKDRLLHSHNPNVTLMRTTSDESRKIGEWIGAKLNRMDGPVRFLIPELGVSALDIEGGVFFDPEADKALFRALESTVNCTDRRQLIRLDCHLNDPAFADAAVRVFREIIH